MNFISFTCPTNSSRVGMVFLKKIWFSTNHLPPHYYGSWTSPSRDELWERLQNKCDDVFLPGSSLFTPSWKWLTELSFIGVKLKFIVVKLKFTGVKPHSQPLSSAMYFLSWLTEFRTTCHGSILSGFSGLFTGLLSSNLLIELVTLSSALKLNSLWDTTQTGRSHQPLAGE